MGLTQITTGGVDDNINIDSNTLKVDGTNNRVGVGTAAPTRDLEVSKAGSAYIRAINTTNSVNIDVLAGTSAAFVGPQSNHPLAFQTNNTERMRIDSSGNLNVGTTGVNNNFRLNVKAPSGNGGIAFVPATDGTTVPVIRMLNAAISANVAEIGTVSGSHFYISTGATERLRIDSSGQIKIPAGSFDLRVGDDIDANAGSQTISVGSISSGAGGLQCFANPTNGQSYLQFGDGSAAASQYRGYVGYKHANDALVFGSASTERMRIDSSGNVGIGTSSPDAKLTVKGSGGGTGLSFRGTDSSGNTNFWVQDGGKVGVHYSPFLINRDYNDTTPSSYFYVHDSSSPFIIDTSGRVGIGTTTSTNRLRVHNGSDSDNIILATGADESSEFISLGISGGLPVVTAGGVGSTSASLAFRTANNGTESERMRIDTSGRLLVGKTIASFQTQGNVLSSNGSQDMSRDTGALLFLNRISNDGNLIQFYHAGNLEGSISVSGHSVSYGGGHLARWSQLPSGAARTEILRGSVLSNLDEMCEWGEEDNEQLNRMKVSDVEGDRNVSGVFQCWDDDDDTYVNDFYCAMTGDFVIRIAQGTTVARGDLLMSAGDGTAKPQDDDIVRSKTIAKVTSTTVSTTYSDNSYCVPCVLMAC